MTDLRAALEVCARERGSDALRLPYDGPDGQRRILVGRRSATAELERSVAEQAAEVGLRIFGRRGCPHQARVECFDVVGGLVPAVIEGRSLAMLEIPRDLAVPDPRARSLHRRVVLCSEQRARLRGGRVSPAAAMAFEMDSLPTTWPDARLDAAIAVWAATVAVTRVAGPLALARQLGTFPSAALDRLACERDDMLAWLVLSAGMLEGTPGLSDAATAVAWSGLTGTGELLLGSRRVRRSALWGHLGREPVLTRARVQRFCAALLELEGDPNAVPRADALHSMTAWAPPCTAGPFGSARTTEPTLPTRSTP